MLDWIALERGAIFLPASCGGVRAMTEERSMGQGWKEANDAGAAHNRLAALGFRRSPAGAVWNLQS